MLNPKKHIALYHGVDGTIVLGIWSSEVKLLKALCKYRMKYGNSIHRYEVMSIRVNDPLIIPKEVADMNINPMGSP